ncbi:hypothetical protein [Roseinatronobacter monicus]|uniref:hypothetical protein n=1 Tax=Roseinatronobacter monicus TaxID=393481 RepID=UPI00114EE426|nr:hypothetical protein [Roseinatronobacter monicus]
MTIQNFGNCDLGSPFGAPETRASGPIPQAVGYMKERGGTPLACSPVHQRARDCAFHVKTGDFSVIAFNRKLSLANYSAKQLRLRFDSLFFITRLF